MSETTLPAPVLEQWESAQKSAAAERAEEVAMEELNRQILALRERIGTLTAERMQAEERRDGHRKNARVSVEMVHGWCAAHKVDPPAEQPPSRPAEPAVPRVDEQAGTWTDRHGTARPLGAVLVDESGTRWVWDRPTVVPGEHGGLAPQVRTTGDLPDIAPGDWVVEYRGPVAIAEPAPGEVVATSGPLDTVALPQQRPEATAEDLFDPLPPGVVDARRDVAIPERNGGGSADTGPFPPGGEQRG
jgi:hypothetical protein